MKYPNWETYTEWLDRVTLEVNSDIVKQELRLDTHNGTSKDDLLHIVLCLSKQNNRLKRTVDKLQKENVRLRRMLEDVEIERR